MILKTPLVVDVAYNNVKVDWGVAFSRGVEAVICKATESIFIEDREFKNNWPQLEGKPRAAYHFYRWWARSAWQAKFFVKTINKYGGLKKGDKLVLDDEEPGHMSISAMIDFSYNVELLTGIRPIWYSNSYLLNALSFRKLSSSQVDYVKSVLQWPAGYPDAPDLFVSPPKAYIPDQSRYGKVVMWQYDSEVPGVAGIPGGTDVNWIDKDFLAQWKLETSGD